MSKESAKQNMKFCDFCDNMMYISLTKDKKMSYECKNCNNITIEDTQDSVCVLDNNYIDDEANYKQYLTKYLKYDNTLPRVTNIKCANEKCHNHTKEVIIVKYDFTNMKYLYHCEYCGEFWRIEKN